MMLSLSSRHIHREGGAGSRRRYNIETPRQKQTNLPIQNAIKSKIEDPCGNFVQKPLTAPPPSRDFCKNMSHPLPWIFICVQLWI
jgi:hypothetical protein